MTSIHALEIAEHIVTDGFDAQRDAVTMLSRAAAERRVNPVLIEVVGDDAAPRPVRERALGRLVVQLSRVA